MDTLQANPGNPEETKIELNRESLVYLLETGGWANFLAILLFVLLGFLVLGALSIGAFIPETTPDGSPFPIPVGFFITIYLAVAFLYFFPAYYLFNFANQVRSGIRFRDPNKVSSALRNLKSHYKFIGIMSICLIAFYILMIILFIALGAGKMLGDSVNA